MHVYNSQRVLNPREANRLEEPRKKPADETPGGELCLCEPAWRNSSPEGVWPAWRFDWVRGVYAAAPLPPGPGLGSGFLVGGWLALLYEAERAV